MSNDMITQEQLEDLANGKTVEFDNYLLRVVEHPDDFTDMNDYDCYGKAVPAYSHRDRANVADRPSDFDGTAELIWTQSDRYWWQPPCFSKEDRRYWHEHPEYRNELRESVRMILSFGFSRYVLEVLDKKQDAYGRNFVVLVFASGGHEPVLSVDDKVSIIRDLIDEMTYDGLYAHI